MNASVPATKTAAYAVGQLLHKHGPMTPAEIFCHVDYGTSNFNRRTMLETWADRGWFWIEDDKIDLTAFARKYMDDQAPQADKPKFVGSMATGPQINMMTRPPYKSPRRVVRDDVPAWSIRSADFGFKSAMAAREVAA